MPTYAIIGAGPAGSVAAIHLARAGRSVTLVEQHPFPRDKVCGECLSALGLDVLAHLGLTARLQRAAALALARVALHPPGGPPLILPLPHPMCGLSRAQLDTILLDAARDAGATVLQPVRCQSVHGTITLRDLRTSALFQLHADWTLLADGRPALLDRRPPPTADLGVKAHFANVVGPRDTIDLYGLQGHYVGAAPIESGLTNVAYSVPRHRVQQRAGDLDALWQDLLHENPELHRRFHAATRTSRWLTCPLPRFPVGDHWPDRIIPLGNSAAALEPIGGEGMGLAMQSARLAAELLIHSPRPTPDQIRSLRDQFDRLWRTRRFACRTIAMLLSRPALASPVLDLARNSDSLSRLALSLMGKT